MSTSKSAKHHLTGDGSFQSKETRDNGLLAGLLSDLDHLLKDGSSADLHFLIEEEVVPAHRLIVLARCDRYRSKKRLKQPVSPEKTPLTIQLGKHFSASAVRDVVQYLYTGKVSLHNDAPFSLLQVCAEFGLPLLQSYLTRHVTSHLTPETVCQTLVGASSLMKSCKDESLKHALKQIVQESWSYVISHTRAVFQGKGFLDLPKDMFIGIISSNKLTIPEEEVWHAVVEWGQHNAGVKQTVLLWTEEDRALVKQALQGVLEEVRIMEISSETFAKEVEPTGLLSMEMTLARYRHAAMHGNGHGSEGSLASSRAGAQEPFADSAILEGQLDLQLQIVEWIDPVNSQQNLPSQSMEWVLLYRASRDGFSARDFHSSCDDKGTTVTVIKTPGGCIFGGYSDVSWSSRFKRGKFASSHNCFLYSLQGPPNTQPIKLPIQQPSYAINNHPGNGPIFGSGADLFVSSECDKNEDSYSQLGHSYGDSSLPPGLFTGEQYFTIEDYEVFGLTI